MNSLHGATFFLAIIALFAATHTEWSGRVAIVRNIVPVSAVVIFGMLSGLLDYRAVLILSVFALSLWFLRLRDAKRLSSAARPNYTDRLLDASAYLAVFALMVSMLAHFAAGFPPITLADSVQYSEHSSSTRLLLGLDKVLPAILLITILGPALMSPDPVGKTLRVAVTVGLLTISLVMACGVTAGIIRFEPKWHDLALYWIFGNLFLTCVGEEVFFRGFIQHRLSLALASVRHGQLISISVVSLAFGLVHLPGGLTYAALAMLAGFGYGFVYWRTQSLLAAILVHFFLNFAHFMLFTYPASLPAP